MYFIYIHVFYLDYVKYINRINSRLEKSSFLMIYVYDKTAPQTFESHCL